MCLLRIARRSLLRIPYKRGKSDLRWRGSKVSALFVHANEWDAYLYTVPNLFLILILHVIISGGSVKADILVLAKVEENTSKAQVTTRLMDGFDTAFKKRLGISAVIVNGKWSTTDNNFLLI